MTIHESSAAVATSDAPVCAWVGGGQVCARSFEISPHDDSRGPAGGGTRRRRGNGILLPVDSDRDCRLHTADDLVVVDGGSFPTGTGANPTLTIMGDAWRVAERIAAGRDASSRG